MSWRGWPARLPALCSAARGCGGCSDSRLFPDKYDGSTQGCTRLGAFASTILAFFLAEIGDKTQIATIGLAARFEEFYPVVIGTTLGMMLANIPAVLIGDRIADKLPVRAIRIAAAAVFVVLGVLTIAGIGG